MNTLKCARESTCCVGLKEEVSELAGFSWLSTGPICGPGFHKWQVFFDQLSDYQLFR